MSDEPNDAQDQERAEEYVEQTVADAAEIARLAALPPIEYDRARETSARRLKIRVATLDDEVAKERAKNAPQLESFGQGQVIELPAPEPYDQPVNLGEVLDDASTTLRTYVIITEVQAVACALFTAFTHVIDGFDVSPIFSAHSAEPRSGKSKLTLAMSRMAPRSFAVSGISASSLLRLIEMNQQAPPTLSVDEMDSLMKRDPAMTEALRGLINSGFDRELARHVMNVPSPDGGYEPRSFSVWSAKIFSGIGKWMPRTVRDRSIVIELKRKKRDEKVKRLRRRDGDDLREIGRKFARWSADNIDRLRSAEPGNVPAALNDRAADAWEPLFAIADLAGGAWPRRARAAAISLSGDGNGTPVDDGIGVMLLADILELWKPVSTDYFASAMLVEELVKLPERPWAEFSRGKPITQKKLADLLGEYGIRSEPIRPAEGKQFRGYKREWLQDAWERYLPQTGSETAAQSVNVSQNQQPSAFLSDSEASQQNRRDTLKNARNADGIGISDTLTDQTTKIAPGAGKDPRRRPQPRLPRAARGNGSSPPGQSPDDTIDGDPKPYVPLSKRERPKFRYQ